VLLLSCPAQQRFAAKIRAAANAAPAQPSFVAEICAAPAQPTFAAKIRAADVLQPSFVAKIRFVLLLLLLLSCPAQPRFAANICAAAAQSSTCSKICAEYLTNASAKEFWACRSFLSSTFRDHCYDRDRRRATALFLSSDRTATSTSDHC
jgi:hypothetical protein